MWGYTNNQKAYAQSVGTTNTNMVWIDQRDPTVNDIAYPIGQFWINQSGKRLFYLQSQSNQVTASNPNGFLQSNWELISVDSVLISLSDTSNTPVFASSSSSTPPDNIQLVGGPGISVVSNPGSNLLTITNTGTTSDFSPDTGTNPVSGSTVVFTNTSILATGTLANAIRSNGTDASTIAYQLQYAGSNAGSSAASKWGVAQFDSNQFNVSSGFVQLAGGTTAPLLKITPDAHTPPGTSPVLPNGSGNITIEGGATFATGTRANPIRTNSLAANTIDLEIQLAGSNAGSSTANDFGVAQFDSNSFVVTNGFVTLKNGGTTGAVTNIIGDDSLTVVPSSGAITLEGVTVANATNSKPVYFKKNATSIEELDVQLTTTSSSAAKNINKSGLCHFDSAAFTVDSGTGFVQLIGGSAPAIQQITTSDSNTVTPSGTPENVNLLGSGSITTTGTGSTATIQLTGLTQYDVLVGQGSTTIGLISPSTSGFVLTSNGASAYPTFQAVSASGAVTQFNLDAVTTPIFPAAGVITLTGGQVATGVVGANVIRTRGNTGSSCTIEIQRSTVSAASNSSLNGVCHFSSTQFGVDANGYVTFIGSTSNIPWTDEGGNFAAASNNGYFCTAALTATLPATPAQGDIIRIVCDTASIVTIQANTGQKIRIANQISSTAGTATSTKQGDTLDLVYRSSSATWYAFSSPCGVWGLT
jgi:hypothetical protein